nr:hypothetical protein [Microbispora sp. GKU 823]
MIAAGRHQQITKPGDFHGAQVIEPRTRCLGRPVDLSSRDQHLALLRGRKRKAFLTEATGGEARGVAVRHDSAGNGQGDQADAVHEPLHDERRDRRRRPVEDPFADAVQGVRGGHAAQGVLPRCRLVVHAQYHRAALGVDKADQGIGQQIEGGLWGVGDEFEVQGFRLQGVRRHAFADGVEDGAQRLRLH